MKRLKILDKFTGNDYTTVLNFYREAQWYRKSAIHDLQVEKLKALLLTIQETSSYYGNIIKKNVDVKNVKDLSVLDIFPITDKRFLKENYNEIIHYRVNHLKDVRKGWTGGTTGEPLTLLKDSKTISSIWGAYYRFYDWMDIEYGDPTIAVWGKSVKETTLMKKLKQFITRRLENVKYISAYHIDNNNVEGNISLFENHKPILLRGYKNTIKEMAMTFKDIGFEFPLRAVSTTVDPLFESDRKLFREIFHCETFDQYGCGEVGSMAFECEAHQGLHVTNERCIIETNLNSELIVTDLDNTIMPIIRYKNGDLIELTNKKCSCGRAGDRILQIKGRTGDVIIGENGKRVHPVFFNNILNESYLSKKYSIKNYKVIQHSKDQLEWKIVVDELKPDDKNYMSAEVKKVLGDISVEIKVVYNIPALSNGKYKFVESLINSTL